MSDLRSAERHLKTDATFHKGDMEMGQQAFAAGPYHSAATISMISYLNQVERVAFNYLL